MASAKPKTTSRLNRLPNRFLFGLTLLLLLFIPLFPKIPLFSPIETYIVRVRPEDILVLVASLVWFWQLIRGKIRFKSSASWLILAYLLAGLLSVVSALFFLQSVPLIPAHVFKTLLHYLRYFQYFMLFFIIYSSVYSERDFRQLLSVIFIALFVVIVYGIGQKYFQWPVYSTMNREFSKGIRLYLTEHARVQSTFAGHYDLAAYLVIALPLTMAFAFASQKRWRSWLLHSLHALGVWILILTASRTSFAAYVLAALTVLFLFALRQANWKNRFIWLISRGAAWGLVLTIVIYGFGGNLKTRLVQTLQTYPELYQTYQAVDESLTQTGQQLASNFDWSRAENGADQTEEKASAEANASPVAAEDEGVLVPSDERPTPQRPGDVYEDIPDEVRVATISATGETEYITVKKPRVWSENALEHGLSLAIRLDSLWPRAIRGFLRQPFLGSGYATLNKTSITDFTIADSTDNNFLRILGETGLLGFLTFFGVTVAGLGRAWLNLKNKDYLLVALSIAYLGATLGLLLNAFYIDVFAASKVAFTFWAVTGLLFGYTEVVKQRKSS